MWFHFEGRNLDAAELMMRYIRESMPVASISVEIEALRNDWGSAMKLIFLADYVFISKDYLREKLGFQSAEPFFEAIMSDRWGKMLAEKAKAFICPWGPEGVYYLDMREQIKHHAPAPRIDSVVETIGAGDTFIGASLAGLSGGKVPLDQVVRTACEIASTKCTKRGLAVSNEDKVTWQMQFNCKDESVGANAA
ncbi:unnamed protein product [Phytophthora lilii]|uniref:Unnamed protein product n=1 Tax=Phytophthora lilii TaxID=2077276 RepID=A0A9W6X5U6_9STRA|nr:unnamed protein product [Phytophthora lilii]